MARDALRFTKDSAIARPIPRVPPVTTAIKFSISISSMQAWNQLNTLAPVSMNLKFPAKQLFKQRCRFHQPVLEIGLLWFTADFHQSEVLAEALNETQSKHISYGLFWRIIGAIILQRV